VPFSAWYEFRGARGRKEVYAFRVPGSIVGLAGIWESWRNPEDGAWVQSFAIITTTPSIAAAAVHDRMPVVLHPDDYDAWLTTTSRADSIQAMMQPWDGQLEVFRTSGYAADSRHEGPECIAPWKAITSNA